MEKNVEGWCINLDYVTLKYDSNGSLLWAQRYSGPGNGWDYPIALAVDKHGNVYVAGYIASSGTGDDYATLKYDPDGNLLWEQRYNGPGNGEDRISALAMDKHGNVYVTGYSEGSGTARDYTTLKYDPDGNLLWEQRYNGPGNRQDSASALAVDKYDNVYVTGYSSGSWPDTDVVTIKYSQ